MPFLIQSKFDLNADVAFESVRLRRADAHTKPFTDAEAFDVLGALNELHRNVKGYHTRAFLWAGDVPSGVTSVSTRLLPDDPNDFCVVFVSVKPDFNTLAGVYAFAWHNGTLFTDRRTPPDAALSQMIAFMQTAGLEASDVSPLENAAADETWRATRAAAFAISMAQRFLASGASSGASELPPSGAFSVTTNGTPAPIEAVLAAAMRVPQSAPIESDGDVDSDGDADLLPPPPHPKAPLTTFVEQRYERTLPFNGALRLYL